jgi:Fe-S oxidoreductase
MLTLARRQLVRLLANLRDELRAGTPVVVLEPSCLSVLRRGAEPARRGDEDPAASHQAVTLGELFAYTGTAPPVRPVGRPTLVQWHCHQNAVLGRSADRRLFGAAGLLLQEPDAGCCVTAGSFGFESGKYDVSRRIGERVLLPAVRRASGDTLVIADGFSCHEQIAQGTGRAEVHTAEVLAGALRANRP